MVGWVFFRADTLSHAAAYLGAMAGVQPATVTPFGVGWFLTPEVLLALGVGTVGSAPIVPALTRFAGPAPIRPTGVAATAALVLVLAASILQIAGRSYDPFIYFRF
jgi:alginate O-acetyltransferase complex protein AlgI